ncbi:MAG: type II secretion system protein [Gemmatimonadota bacterium]
MLHHRLAPSATALPASNAPRRVGRAGMTLIEVMIALVLVGILSGIAASRLDWGKYRADSVGRGVLTDLANAQRLAVSLQSNVRVSIPDPARLQILEDADDNGVADPAERVRSLPLDDRYTFAKGTAIDTPAPADPTALTLLTFRRDGSANRSGTFYIAGPGDDPTCHHCRAVAVTRATGRVVLYSYATGAWKRAN